MFYIQDHLGNNTVVVHQNGAAVMQRTYYHPFGKPIGNGESTGEAFQPYKFGGKEQQTMLGLTQYDFSARTLDYSYNRFTSVDPLAEKYYSVDPYAYCANNPVNNIDLTGMDWVRQVDGEIVWRSVVTKDNYTTMLSTGETYMGGSHYVRDGNGNLVEEYRSDGTINRYNNEQIGLLDIFNPDYNSDGKSSWWEWGIDGVLYAGDLLLGGPTGESLVAKGALMGITKGAGKSGAKAITERVVKGFTKHGLEQTITRGIKPKTILNVIKNGKVIEKTGRYGSQLRYTLDNITVVVAKDGKNAGKIITVMTH